MILACQVVGLRTSPPRLHYLDTLLLRQLEIYKYLFQLPICALSSIYSENYLTMFSSFRRHKDEPSAPGPTPPPINNQSRPDMSGQQPFQYNHQDGNRSYAPKFHNIHQGDTVHERIFLLHGGAGPANTEFDGSLVVYHHINAFPSQRWPVSDGYFKALVHLQTGVNNLKFEYEGPNGDKASSNLTIHYIPLLQNRPLHLALILGSDSPGTFDSPTYKREKEGNDLDLAIKKVRMAGYMMAAFTDEQMNRNGFGHRTFRLHEEYDKDSLSNRDGRGLRSTAMVHVIRSKHTVAEIRDPNRAQQNPNGNDTGALFNYALEAINAHGHPFENKGEDVMVACIFVDTHWDTQQKLVLGHAALGGGAGHIKLAIFGSHSLHAWPSCLEEIVPCFMDETRTDTTQVANDANQSGTSAEALNIGMGAFMHEIGHLLGCPHQPYGVMLRDYVTWNRSFMTREGWLSRDNKPGRHLCLPENECGWHRLDVLRFRAHPAFRSPFEDRIFTSSPSLYPVENGAFVKSVTGVYLIEIHVDGECRGHLEWPNQPQTEIFLYEDDLRKQLPEKFRSADKKMKLEILGVGQTQCHVDDFVQLTQRDQIHDTFERRRGVLTGFKSAPLGNPSGDLYTTIIPPNPISLKIFAGHALNGVEFFYADRDPVIFGNHGGSPNEFKLQMGEYIVGYFVRAGAWIDAIQVITNMRRSDVYGNKTGGGAHEMVPPHGYEIVGLYGHLNSWVCTLGLIYVAGQ